MRTISVAEHLRESGRNIAFPFLLPLVGDKEILVAQQSLRILPGKRLTVLAQWGEHRVVAKLFYHPKRWISYAERDASGIRALITKKIRTPKLLYHGPTKIPGIHVVILEYIDNAENLGHYLIDNVNTVSGLSILNQLFKIIAQQHQAGLKQQDIHLDNFLVAQEQIYTIDGNDIIVQKRALSETLSLENLSMLFSHLPISLDDAIPQWLSRYCAIRGWDYNSRLLAKLQQQIALARAKHQRERMDKIFRDCTEFIVNKTHNKRVIYLRDYDTPEMLHLFDNLEDEFSAGVHPLLKNGNTCTIIQVPLHGKVLVIKRYNIKSLWHGLKRGLRRTRAANSWRSAHRLINLGIQTAKPIALVEERCLWFWRRKAYFITEYVAGNELSHYVTSDNVSLVAKEVGVLLKHLSQAGLSHGDMKATNLIHNQSGVSLIDLDSMKKHKHLTAKSSVWQTDMKRFLKNWDSKDSIQQYFKQYFSEEGIL